MPRMWSFLSVGLVAAAMVLPTVGPSSAAPHDDQAGAAIAGGVLGFMAGAAAANGDNGPPPPPHHRGWGMHVQMCEDHYGWRYDPRSDMVRMHGHFFRCDDWPGRGPDFGPPPPPPGYYGPPRPHHYGPPPPPPPDAYDDGN